MLRKPNKQTALASVLDTHNTPEQPALDTPSDTDRTGPEPAKPTSTVDDETRDVAELLEALSELGITLRCKRGNERDLWATPRERIGSGLAELIKKHKKRIIYEMHQKKAREEGTIESETQVFELAMERWG